MTVKQFRTLSGNKGRFVSIPVDSIRLVSDIHKKKPADASKINKPYKNLLVIVHKNKDDTYDLITGWRDYIIAVRDGVKEIKAILYNRREFRIVCIAFHTFFINIKFL